MAVQIKRERPDQRRYHRLTAPLFVSLEGREPVRAKDWSLGGLALVDVQGELPDIGRTFNLSLMLPFQGYDISFEVEAEVARVDETEALIGFQFVDMPERSHDLLNHFTEDLIRGRMGTIEDSICRIDVPVTPISTKPTTNHISETPVRRLPFKTIAMSAIYFLVGILVFFHAAILIYSNFMRLEVASSVVSTELQTLKMPVDGIIRLINFKEGERVKAGDKILMISDMKLERQISAAKLNIEAAEKSLWQTKQKHRIETERLKLYQIVSRTDKNIAEARLVSLREALRAADAHFLRMAKLKKSGYGTAKKFDEAKKIQANAASAVREAELLLEKNAAMNAASKRRHYNHKEFTTDLDMLAVDLEMAYSTLKREVRQLELLDEIKEKFVLRAPFDGRIVDLYQSAYTNITRNEPLLLLERDNGTTVTAYLNQKEILEVGLYDEAKVFIPALNKHILAVVSKIDRSSLYLNKTATRYTWRDEKDRTAAVTLDLQVDERGASQIRAGLPVVVIFDRRETNDIWSKIKGFVGATPTVEQESGTSQKI